MPCQNYQFLMCFNQRSLALRIGIRQCLCQRGPRKLEHGTHSVTIRPLPDCCSQLTSQFKAGVALGGQAAHGVRYGTKFLFKEIARGDKRSTGHLDGQFTLFGFNAWEFLCQLLRNFSIA